MHDWWTAAVALPLGSEKVFCIARCSGFTVDGLWEAEHSLVCRAGEAIDPLLLGLLQCCSGNSWPIPCKRWYEPEDVL